MINVDVISVAICLALSVLFFAFLWILAQSFGAAASERWYDLRISAPFDLSRINEMSLDARSGAPVLIVTDHLGEQDLQLLKKIADHTNHLYMVQSGQIGSVAEEILGLQKEGPSAILEEEK